jgi:hypothetical protein
VLRNVGKWQGRKILVTGVPDAELRARATNSGLIDGFLAKSGAALLPEVGALVERFQAEPDPRLQRLWRGTLSGDQLAALERPGAAEAVRAMLGPYVTEYIVLSDPFGVLALDGEGNLGWLPFSLGGEPVSDFALREALELTDAGGHAAVALPITDSGLGGALFRVPTAPNELELPVGYGRWLQQQRGLRAPEVSRGKNHCAYAARTGGLVEVYRTAWWPAGVPRRSDASGADRCY